MPIATDPPSRTSAAARCARTRRTKAVGARSGCRRVSYMGLPELERHDEVALPLLAEHERVRAEGLEAGLAVEGDRLRVVLPHAEPEPVGARGLRALDRVLEERLRDALALPPGDHVDAVELRGPPGREQERLRPRRHELGEADQLAGRDRERRHDRALPDLARLDVGPEVPLA